MAGYNLVFYTHLSFLCQQGLFLGQHGAQRGLGHVTLVEKDDLYLLQDRVGG